MFPETINSDDTSFYKEQASSSNAGQSLMKSLSTSLDDLLNVGDDNHFRTSRRRASGGQVLDVLPDLVSVSGTTLTSKDEALPGGKVQNNNNNGWRARSAIRTFRDAILSYMTFTHGVL